MTTIVILAFVRWQQLDAVKKVSAKLGLNGDEQLDLDAMVAEHDASWQDHIKGFSLRHVHQLSNTLYLVLVTFLGAGMILYLFAYTLEQAKAGQPLPLSWQFVVAIVALLAFCSCVGFRDPGSTRPSTCRFSPVRLPS